MHSTYLDAVSQMYMCILDPYTVIREIILFKYILYILRYNLAPTTNIVYLPVHVYTYTCMQLRVWKHFSNEISLNTA